MGGSSGAGVGGCLLTYLRDTYFGWEDWLEEMLARVKSTYLRHVKGEVMEILMSVGRVIVDNRTHACH